MASTFTITASRAMSYTVQRTNLASDPRATGLALGNAQAGWGAGRWFGSGGAGTYSWITSASDGPPGLGLSTYLRKTWTTAPSSNADTGFANTVGADNGTETTGLPVIGGATYTVSSYLRASSAKISAGISVWWHDATGVFISLTNAPTVALPAGQWTRISGTVTAPSNAAFAQFVSDVDAGTTWAVSDTLDGTGLLVEQSGAVGTYFDGATAGVGDQSRPGAIKYTWTGTANASTSTQGLAAVDPTVVPSVKIVVTQSGTPALSSVTVNRTDQAGNVFPVRTSDGDVLTISGGTGTAYDYEAPYGQTLTYTVAANNNPTATVTLAVTRPWLVHLGFPKRSVTFTTGRGSSNLAESWDIPQAIYPILGGGYPIVISGGSRLAPSLTLPVLVQTAADLAALRTLLSDGCPLLLNTPPGYGIDPAYIAVGKVASSRLSSIMVHPDRLVELPYQVIGRPFGPAQAPVIWSDLPTESWSAISAGTTWAQLATP